MTRTLPSTRRIRRSDHGIALLVALLAGQAIGLPQALGLPLPELGNLSLPGVPALLLGLGLIGMAYALVLAMLARRRAA